LIVFSLTNFFGGDKATNLSFESVRSEKIVYETNKRVAKKNEINLILFDIIRF